MSVKKCTNCQAEFTGLVCKKCGKAAESFVDTEKQQKALDEYHRHLQRGNRREQIQHLKHGYIPNNPKLLIDAGLYTIPHINEEDILQAKTEAALKRLQVIVTKLSMCEHNQENANALSMFRKIIDKFEYSEAREKLIFGVIGHIIVYIVLFYILYEFVIK